MGPTPIPSLQATPTGTRSDPENGRTGEALVYSPARGSVR